MYYAAVSCFAAHAGSTKMVVQYAHIMDQTGAIGPTAFTQEGGILVPWNPDASYVRDAFLRVQAKLGTPTADFSIYDHMDVMVHPLGVHLTEKFASQLWVGSCTRPVPASILTTFAADDSELGRMSAWTAATAQLAFTLQLSGSCSN